MSTPITCCDPAILEDAITERIRAIGRVHLLVRVNEYVWRLYVVQDEERDRVVAELRSAGTSVGIHYPISVHLTPAYEHLGYGRGRFPVAEVASDRILSLPMSPNLRDPRHHVTTNVLCETVFRP